MTDDNRSEQVCPVCGKHMLAVDEPPRIDVMGIQVYSDIVGMGDVTPGGALGIVCLGCETRWANKAALERGESLPPLEEVVTEPGFFDEDEDQDGDDDAA
jgi:hypothetical protein